MSAADFKDMTFEQFAGTPRIVKSIEVRTWPRLPPSTTVLFMEDFGLAASYFADGGDVWRGSDRIAWFDRGHSHGRNPSGVYVMPEYRGHDIAEELIYQTMVRTPGLTTPSSIRTEQGHKIYRRVYDRLMRDAGCDQ